MVAILGFKGPNSVLLDFAATEALPCSSHVLELGNLRKNNILLARVLASY